MGRRLAGRSQRGAGAADSQALHSPPPHTLIPEVRSPCWHHQCCPPCAFSSEYASRSQRWRSAAAAAAAAEDSGAAGPSFLSISSWTSRDSSATTGSEAGSSISELGRNHHHMPWQRRVAALSGSGGGEWGHSAQRRRRRRRRRWRGCWLQLQRPRPQPSRLTVHQEMSFALESVARGAALR